jgi:hypothetical protein
MRNTLTQTMSRRGEVSRRPNRVWDQVCWRCTTSRKRYFGSVQDTDTVIVYILNS